MGVFKVTGKLSARVILPFVLFVLLSVGCATQEPTAAGEAAPVREGSPSVVAPALTTEPLPEAPRLADYLAYAAKNNPGLEAAFNRWKAALERVPQVRSLPDPRFTYKYFIEKVETRVGPQRHSFTLAQTFPWFGKLDLRGEAAGQAALAAKERYEAVKLALFYRVKEACYEYAYLARAIEIVRENRDLAKYFESVARMRYKVAAAKHPDVIRAQVELAKLDDRLAALEELRSPVAARVNAALNRSIDAPVPWPENMPRERIAPSDKQLLAWLETDNPELGALQHEIERERRGIELAAKNYYPDVTVGMMYIGTDKARMHGVSDSGKDPVAATVSVNLPIWHKKYDASRREALARYKSAVKTKMDRGNRLKSEAKMALYRFQDAERKIDLYRDTLLPKARQSMKVTEAAFRVGKATFLELVDSQRVMLEFQLVLEGSLADHGQHLARIEMLIGRSIPRAPAKGPK